MNFDEYCKKNQHSGNCTRLEAFSMGQKSRKAEIDELKKRIDGALQLLEYNEYVDSELQAINILKGNKDEN